MLEKMIWISKNEIFTSTGEKKTGRNGGTTAQLNSTPWFYTRPSPERRKLLENKFEAPDGCANPDP